MEYFYMIRRKKSDSQILFVISDWKNNKHKIEVRISQLVEVVDVVHFISLLTLYLGQVQDIFGTTRLQTLNNSVLNSQKCYHIKTNYVLNNFRTPPTLIRQARWLRGQQNTKEIRFTGGANKHKLLFGFLADEALLRKSSVLAFQGFEVGGIHTILIQIDLDHI